MHPLHVLLIHPLILTHTHPIDLRSMSMGIIPGGGVAISESHFEDLYVIGDQLGSGMSGQVHLCMNRTTRYFTIPL